MAKKRRKRSKKQTTHPANTPKPRKIVIEHTKAPEKQVDKILIENFVALQRVLTNLAINVDNLSSRISKLLDLFEISAKALAEKDFDMQEENTELKGKLDSLLDQNKILARGMALMHERMPREQFPPPMPTPPPRPQPQQFPARPMQEQFMPENPSYTQEVAPEQFPPPAPLQKRRTQETPAPPAPINQPDLSKKQPPSFESPVE